MYLHVWLPVNKFSYTVNSSIVIRAHSENEILYFLFNFYFLDICFYLINLIVLDVNRDENKDLQEEATSPSKRTKSLTEVNSPSVVLSRMPLSPRKDLNLSSPARESQDRASAPNTLPKASLQAAERQLMRTRRNLTSSFASLSSDASSLLQQRYNSLDEIRDKTQKHDVIHVDSKTTNDVLKSTSLSSVTADTTPSKPCVKVGTPSESAATSSTSSKPSRKVGTPSKAAVISSTPSEPCSKVSTQSKASATSSTPSKPSRKVGTPSKAKQCTLIGSPSKTTETVSQPESFVIRLVKDTGMLLT